jgi:hypothetical protein
MADALCGHDHFSGPDDYQANFRGVKINLVFTHQEKFKAHLSQHHIRFGRVMSFVLDVLDETKWAGYLYHATHGSFNPKKMKSGSHLGSLESAVHRGVDIYKSGGSSMKIHAFEYHPSGRSEEVKDNWGGLPAKDSIAAQLRNKGVISHDEYHAVHHKNPERLDKQGLPVGVSDRKLSKLLRSKGVSHVTYKNVAEKGGMSHVIYDPENLHHVHTFDNPNRISRVFR